LSEVKRNKYKAVRLRSTDGASTGIGIQQYNREGTTYIASLYFDSALTNRQAFNELAKHIEGPAKVRMVNIRGFKHNRADVKYVSLRGGRHTNEAKTLAADAIRRITNITEIMETE
jgi:hypothetical protein